MGDIVILKAGRTLPDLAAQIGDFEDWTAAGLGRDVTVRAVLDGDIPTDYDNVSGIVITGSHDYITDEQPWMLHTMDWLRGAVARDIPILGVCFGHQMLAVALGGTVGDNPYGVEICTTTVELTDAAEDDPLFAGLSSQLQVHAAHFHAILQPPPGITVLAHNRMDAHHAVRFAPNAWGVQFHPEMRAQAVRAYQISRQRYLPPNPGPTTDKPPVGMDAGAVILSRFAKWVDDYASNSE